MHGAAVEGPRCAWCAWCVCDVWYVCGVCGVCGAVVGLRKDSAVLSGVKSSPVRLSSARERRLVTLSQLTGRTRVLAWARGAAGVVAPSGPAGRWGSWEAAVEEEEEDVEEKAALNLLSSVPTFLSPEKDGVKDRLLACCTWPASCSRCFRCLSSSSFFFLSSSSRLRCRSSSFRRCRSRSRGAVLGRRSCGMKPDG